MKKKRELLAVIAKFVKLAKGENFPIGKVRLTKFLYLLDVEYYRDHKKIYTDFNWKYYWYGPYSPQLESVLKTFNLVDEEIEIASGQKVFKKIKLDNFEDVDEPDIEIEGYQMEIWNRWGLSPLNELLDYVYFETEPMMDIQRGDPLDFKKISPREELKEIHWSDEEKKRLREIGTSIKKKLNKISLPEAVLCPKDTPDVLKIWDDEGMVDLKNLTGTVKIGQSHIVPDE
jgi:hypothetical protein